MILLFIYISFMLLLKLCDAIRCCLKSAHYRLYNTRGKKEGGREEGKEEKDEEGMEGGRVKS